MKIKVKLLLILLVLLIGGCIIYSNLVYRFASLEDFAIQDEKQTHKVIEKTDNIYFDIIYNTEGGKLSEIKVKCINKYILDKNHKLSVHYDPRSLILTSFERKVYAQSLIDTKCIEQSNAPSSSYSGIISWYNAFNIIGCDITVVEVSFDIINPDMDLSDITESIDLEY